MNGSPDAMVCRILVFVFQAFFFNSWYILGSRLGAHTKGPWENSGMCGLSAPNLNYVSDSATERRKRLGAPRRASRGEEMGQSRDRSLKATECAFGRGSKTLAIGLWGHTS